MSKPDKLRNYDELVPVCVGLPVYLKEALEQRAEQLRKMKNLKTYTKTELNREILEEVLMGPTFYVVMERRARQEAEMWKHMREVREGRAQDLYAVRHEGKKTILDQVAIGQAIERLSP